MRITKYTTKLDESNLNILVKESARNYSKHKRLERPEIIAEMLNDILDLQNMAEEYLYLMALDSKSKLLGLFEISHGSVNASICTPREIFIRALLCGATNIILAHNHPSGDPTPSREDHKATRRIKEAGLLMGIKLLDHIIIGRGRYLSFGEEGYL